MTTDQEYAQERERERERRKALGEFALLCALLCLSAVAVAGLFAFGGWLGKRVDVKTVQQWAR